MPSTTHRLEAGAPFRRLTLLGAMVLALLELGLFAVAWRLGVLLDPAGDPRASALFVAFGTVLTLQAMVVVGLAWLMVAMARTTLEFSESGLTLEHPWRRWDGAWHEVRRAWYRGGWLTLETTESARRWYVRTDAGDPRVEDMRQRLDAGVWLDGRALASHLARRIMPLAAAALVLAVVTLWLLSGLAER